VIARATTSPRLPRDPAIDMAKGCAILGVLLIHSDALHGSFLFWHVVNQAVPVFVVLFGVNATFWWARRTPSTDWGAWYARWIDRVMIPVWAILPLWWAMALYFRPWGVTLSWWLPLVQGMGFLLNVGTGWFVTLALQLALLQPVLEAFARRAGHPALLVIGLVLTTAITAVGSVVVGPRELFYYGMFSPRVLGLVAFGMMLAPYVRGLDWRAGVGAAAVLALAVFAREAAAAQFSEVSDIVAGEAAWVGALALTVVLLAVLRPIAHVPVVAPALEWLGQSSYGIYIGQLIVHNFFVYAVGLAQFDQRVAGWPYAGLLLAGGIGFTWLGGALRRAAAALRERLANPHRSYASPPP
jgi:peptidoglycan/LPS O-acetylase OafA/YrhL